MQFADVACALKTQTAISVAVMSETGCNDDIAILFFVDDAMGVVDSPTLPPAQITFQRLGFSDALIGVSLDVLS